MLVSVQGGLFRVNGMSLQAIVAFVAVVMRAHKTDWQAELNLFELLPARAFPPSISVSFLVPALACFPFPALGTLIWNTMYTVFTLILFYLVFL